MATLIALIMIKNQEAFGLFSRNNHGVAFEPNPHSPSSNYNSAIVHISADNSLHLEQQKALHFYQDIAR